MPLIDANESKRMEPPNKPDDALRRVGLKITHPRLRVLELLGQGQHLSAEHLYRQMYQTDQDIGLATIYRVLNQFEATGLALKHNFEIGPALYELNRGTHHDHMVDVETGAIVEFESKEIEALQRAIASQHGYVLEDHMLVLYVRRPSASAHRPRHSSRTLP